MVTEGAVVGLADLRDARARAWAWQSAAGDGLRPADIPGDVGGR
jgi:hypothetical protein